MKLKITLCLSLLLPLHSHAFFMKMMNPMSWPGKAMKVMTQGPSAAFEGMAEGMLSMCDSPVGGMGMAGANMFSSMASGMPFMGSMVNKSMDREMARVLGDPNLTLKALDCAKRNTNAASMMIKGMEKNPALIGRMAAMVAYDERIAASAMHLVKISENHSSLSIGRFLVKNMTDEAFAFFTEALINYDWIAVPFVEIIQKNKEIALRMDSKMMTVMTSWSNPATSYDGNEYAIEKMILAVFSNPQAGKIFEDSLHAQGEDVVSAVFDTLIGGQVYRLQMSQPNYQYEYASYQYDQQASHNAYAMMYAIAKMQKKAMEGLIAPEHVEEMMNHFMQSHLLDFQDGQMPRPRKHGMIFFQHLVNAMAHQDPVITQMAQAMMEKLPPEIQDNMPAPNLNSPKPQAYLMEWLQQ